MAEVEIARFRLRNGSHVLVEIEEEYSDGMPASRGSQRFRDVRDAFGANVASIRDAAEEVLEVLQQASHPDEIKLSFGVKLASEMGAVIAKSAMEGTIGVELLWKRPPVSEES